MNAQKTFELTVEHKTGDRRAYSGASKKEVNRKFKREYPYFFSSIVKKEWEIIED